MLVKVCQSMQDCVNQCNKSQMLGSLTIFWLRFLVMLKDNMQRNLSLQTCTLTWPTVFSIMVQFTVFSCSVLKGTMGFWKIIILTINRSNLKIMRKFICDQNIGDLAFADEYKEQFHGILLICNSNTIINLARLWLTIN